MKVFEKHILLDEIYTSSISRADEMLLFDIETTGLKKETSQMYLIGCGYFEDDEFIIKQWLTQMALDEPLLLENFFELACRKSILVHFNGDGFDIPYTEYKARYYGIDSCLHDMESLDIYKTIKPLKKLFSLERMGQKNIEQFLGIKRQDQYNGGQLISVYHDYERYGAEQNEKKLLLHNYEDVLGMAKMFSMFSYGSLLNGNYTFTGYQRIQDVAVMEFALDTCVPVCAEYICGGTDICVDGSLLQINMAINDNCIKLPLPDPENYYYLPDEDTVIHKDVAQFADKKHRKKATKNNCLLRVEEKTLANASEDEFMSFAGNIIAAALK